MADPSPKTTPVSERLSAASAAASRELNTPEVSRTRLEDALGNAVDPQRLLNNLAEVWRTSPEKTRDILQANGFGPVLARMQVQVQLSDRGEATGAPFASARCYSVADGRIRIRAWNPGLDESATAPQAVLDSTDAGITAFTAQAAGDPLGVLYRDKPAAYAETFLLEQAPKMDAYVREQFGGKGPRYLVNSGIGANEQFNYFVSALANRRSDQKVTWLLANSPKEAASLPADATIENTLFMEFSRSGITEETVKLHELTPRKAKRIVFANAGPLRSLAERDGNLILELPSEVSGRYGRNKTPILLAPMHIVGLDVRSYWAQISAACKQFDLSDRQSAPVALARYVRIQQLRHGVNHIYFGTNDPLLRFSADEFCQYWNEGVNRDGNDITMSRYLGLPRDSHMNLEAILGTSERKMAVFLLKTSGSGGNVRTQAAGEILRFAQNDTDEASPDRGGASQNRGGASQNRGGASPDRGGLLLPEIDPNDAAHRGLSAADVDLVLCLANVKRCSEKMPTILITLRAPDLTSSAWLGQLWADWTLVYSRLIGVDAGSNPEVKAVRTRAAAWLADRKAAFELLGE